MIYFHNMTALIACINITVVGFCQARDTILERMVPDNSKSTPSGSAYRREYDKRLFKHKKWHARLLVHLTEADTDSAIEIYTRDSDKRLWLSYRTAQPSLTYTIFKKEMEYERFNLPKTLDAIKIHGCDMALPDKLGEAIIALWKTLLPGKPPSVPKTIVTHPPIVVCTLRKQDGRVLMGQVGMDAFESKQYIMFTDIIRRLVNFCSLQNDERVEEAKRLVADINALRKRLENVDAASLNL